VLCPFGADEALLDSLSPYVLATLLTNCKSASTSELPQYLRLVWIESRADSLSPFGLAVHDDYSFYERQGAELCIFVSYCLTLRYTHTK
jgi:hypothetical protein